MTIHASDPFATPEGERSQVRRLRGRLPAPVTLWTAGAERERVGLTVSSVLIADGDPGRLLGIVDEESDLWPVLERTGRFAVVLLDADERRMADVLAVINRLPARERDVVALVVWEELDYQSAAAALNIPVGTVRSRLSRARRRLSSSLAAPHIQEER